MSSYAVGKTAVHVTWCVVFAFWIKLVSRSLRLVPDFWFGMQGCQLACTELGGGVHTYAALGIWAAFAAEVPWYAVPWYDLHHRSHWCMLCIAGSIPVLRTL